MVQKTIVVYGELLWDMLPSGPVLGGAPANFAVRASELGSPVQLISKVGDDKLGRDALQVIQSKHISIENISIDSSFPTGTVDVELSSKGDPKYTINTDVAYDHIEWSPHFEELVHSAGMVCFGTLIQRNPVSRDTLYRTLEHAPHAVKLVDINLRSNCYSAATIRASFNFADIVKLNQHEVKPVCNLLDLSVKGEEDFAQKVIELFNLTCCVVTLGERGVFAMNSVGESVRVPGVVVSIVDSIGAGDAFTAGFATKFLSAASLMECCRFGNILGALATERAGGMAPISESEIERHLVRTPLE